MPKRETCHVKPYEEEYIHGTALVSEEITMKGMHGKQMPIDVNKGKDY